MSVRYEDPRHITMKNVQRLSADEVQVAGLCGWVQFAEQVDWTKIQPTLDVDMMVQIVIWTFNSPKGIVASALIKIFGLEATERLIPAVRMIEGEERTAFIREVVEKRVEELNRRAVIPFEFMRVEDHTALTGPFPRQVVTPFAWYGDAYLPANIWRENAIGTAVAIAPLIGSSYELFWVLQMAYPPIARLSEVWLIRALDRIRTAFMA